MNELGKQDALINELHCPNSTDFTRDAIPSVSSRAPIFGTTLILQVKNLHIYRRNARNQNIGPYSVYVPSYPPQLASHRPRSAEKPQVIEVMTERIWSCTNSQEQIIRHKEGEYVNRLDTVATALRTSAYMPLPAQPWDQPALPRPT